jgi:hypothetical protein
MNEEDQLMVARRRLAFVAALLTAAFVAGCAQTVSGTASYAGGTAGQPPLGSGSASPSEDPSGGSSSSSPSSSDSSSSSGDNKAVCDALDKAQVEQLLGTSVTLKQSQASGCQISADNGKSLIVAVFDYLSLSEYKHGTFQNVQVGGHPGVRTDSNIIYVARSSDPAGEGLLAAYYSGLGSSGDSVASALLAQLLKKYSK